MRCSSGRWLSCAGRATPGAGRPAHRVRGPARARRVRVRLRGGGAGERLLRPNPHRRVSDRRRSRRLPDRGRTQRRAVEVRRDRGDAVAADRAAPNAPLPVRALSCGAALVPGLGMARAGAAAALIARTDPAPLMSREPRVGPRGHDFFPCDPCHVHVARRPPRPPGWGDRLAPPGSAGHNGGRKRAVAELLGRTGTLLLGGRVAGDVTRHRLIDEYRLTVHRAARWLLGSARSAPHPGGAARAPDAPTSPSWWPASVMRKSAPERPAGRART